MPILWDFSVGFMGLLGVQSQDGFRDFDGMEVIGIVGI